MFSGIHQLNLAEEQKTVDMSCISRHCSFVSTQSSYFQILRDRNNSFLERKAHPADLQQEFKPAGSGDIDTPKHARYRSGLRLYQKQRHGFGSLDARACVSALALLSVFAQIIDPGVHGCCLLHILSHSKEWKIVLPLQPYQLSIWLTQLSWVLLCHPLGIIRTDDGKPGYLVGNPGTSFMDFHHQQCS